MATSSSLARPERTAKPPRKWRRRLRNLAVAMVAFGVLVIANLSVIVPIAMDQVAAGYGLSIQVEDMDFSPLTGEVRLADLRISRRPVESNSVPGPELLRLEYAIADLDLSALLRLELRVHRLELDGLDIKLERGGDGQWNWLQILADAAAAPPIQVRPDQPVQLAAAKPEPLDLRLPIRMDAIRVQHLRLMVVDRTVSPVVDTWVESSLRVSDLGHPSRSARIQLQAYGPDFLDGLSIEGRLDSEAERMQVDFDFAARGIHPRPAAAWLAALGLVPQARSLSLSSHFSCSLRRNMEAPSSVDVDLGITASALTVDAETNFVVEKILVTGRQLTTKAIWVPEISVSGVRGHVRRLADQTIRVAGFDLVAAPTTPAPDVEQAANPDPVPAFSLGMAARLDLLRCSDLSFRFLDAGMDPATSIELVVDQMSMAGIDTAQPDSSIRIAVDGRVPGVFELGKISGELRPFADDKIIALEVQADSITLARLRPYLAALGLRPDLHRGVASCKVEGAWSLDEEGRLRLGLALRDLSYRDGETLLGLDSMELRDLLLDPAVGRIRVAAVELVGGDLPVLRHPDGTIQLLGLRTAVATMRGPTPPAGVAVSPNSSAAVSAGPRVELDLLRWRGLSLRFEDAGVVPKASFATDAFDVSLSDLAFGGPVTAAPSTARLVASCGITGLAESLRAEGTIQTRPGPLDCTVDLRFSGDGLSLLPLAGYLEPTLVEPLMRAGKLRARLAASLAQGDRVGSLRAAMRLSEIAFGEDLSAPELALDSLQVSGVEIQASGVRISELVIAKPLLRLQRDAEGRWVALGLRVDPGLAEAAPADAELGAESASPELASVASPVLPVVIDKFGLRDATVLWRDAAVQPAVATSLTVQLDATGIATVAQAAPMTIGLQLAVADSLEQASVEGVIRRSESGLTATLECASRGMRAGPLASYLPPGLTVGLRDGRMAGRVVARWSSSETGRHAMALALEEASFRDGTGPVLAACQAVRLAVPLLDLTTRRLQVSELRVQGAEMSIRRETDGVLALLGLGIDPEQLAAAAPARPGPQPDLDSPPSGRVGAKSPWHIGVDKLDLQLANLSFRDAGSQQPLAVSLRLFNPQPMTILSAEPEDLPELRLRVEGAVAPLLEELVVDLSLAPWKPDAEFTLDFTASGIRGGKLPAVLHGLVPELDLSDLRDGSLTAKAAATVRLRRRYPTDIDLQRGFGLSLELADMALRSEPGGEILIGLDSLRVEAPRIVPGGAVHIAEIELGTPRVRVLKDAAGLHLAGLILQLPEGGESSPTVIDAPSAAEPQDVIALNAPEMRIDRISVQGLDVLVRDITVDPPLVVPLTALDVDISNLTTKALIENRSIGFSVSLESGVVDLPERHIASSALVGALVGLGKVATGQDDAVKMEQRPLLDEVSIQGRISLFPQLQGRIRTNLQGLELGALRGMVKSAGVDLSDGVFDAGIDLRLQGEAGIDTRARFTVGHLSLDEKPGGPISSYLKLPAPLQAVVFALRDEINEIVVPLNLTVAGGDVSVGQIAAVAVTTFSKLVVSAIAAAPLRIAGSITGLVGLTGGEVEPVAKQRQVLAFAPGVVSLDDSTRRQVSQLVKLLQGDDSLILQLQHEFGSSDMARAGLLANPTTEQACSIADGLRRQRRELAHQYAEATSAVRSHYGSGQLDAARRDTARLRHLAREIGAIEAGLDTILELLRPGAERRRDRRTRKMALGLGQRRLQRVRELLLRLGGESFAERTQVRRARLAQVAEKGPASVVLTPRVRETQDD